MTLRPFLPRELPPGLEPVGELALDLGWTWSHATDHLWRTIDPAIWDVTHNPWVIIQNAPRERLEALSSDATFRRLLDDILAERRRLQPAKPSAVTPARPTAYFSMEFGLGDALPLYAGGLGVLAGDHLKAASDLGVPLVAVGLLYQQGYFRQTLDLTGRQQELYPYNDPTALPIQPAIGTNGGWLMVSVQLPGRTLWLRVWRVAVGAVMLYLLDSNIPMNDASDRGITAKLYGDGPETRLCQELALGLGGWRVLEALGVAVGACHLNEGHTAFVVLERARSARRALGLTFGAALWGTRAGNIFTSHTPVASGFDTFAPGLLAKYFPDGAGGYLDELGITFKELLALGRANADDDGEPFRPSVLAMRGAGRANGVSALHGATSRRLFQPLFPSWPEREVPVGHVTNGVHVPSWDSRCADQLWTTACGRDRWRGAFGALSATIETLDDATLWTARGRARSELVDRVRVRLRRQLARRGMDASAVEAAGLALDPDVLTLGFARRFAEYKRPNLLLAQGQRLTRMLRDPARPVQLVVAGKAHPADRDGKELVQAWVRFADDPTVRARCVFLEDYDLAVAQELVQGVDVWINTPRPPWEACGTSGMKVLVNGGLNLSSLDGWWAEAHTPETGWAIAGAGSLPDADARDGDALFAILERQVIPMFYDRDVAGMPREWLARVRASMARLTPMFSANRMLDEYVTGYYQPAAERVAHRMAAGGREAKTLADWAGRLPVHWPALRFGHRETRRLAEDWQIGVEVYLNELTTSDVAVQLYADPVPGSERPVCIAMTASAPLTGTAHGYVFSAIAPGDRPATDYTPRIVPTHDGVAVPLELPLILWHRA